MIVEVTAFPTRRTPAERVRDYLLIAAHLGEVPPTGREIAVATGLPLVAVVVALAELERGEIVERRYTLRRPPIT